MYSTLIDLLQTVLIYPLSFFREIVNATDTYAFIIGGFMMITVVRFILKPIFGNAGSDSVRIISNSNERDLHARQHDMW